MSNYSPVAPVHLLQKLLEINLLGPYILVLAHDVLAHPTLYNNLIDDLRARYDHVLVILDNGVIERGEPVSFAELMAAASVVEATVVVGPDVLGDLEATKKGIMKYGDLIHRDYNLMVVPQGNTIREVLECIDWYAERYPGSVLWGIPRWITNNMGSRQFIINDIQERVPGSQMHLLGMSKNLEDDIACTKMPGVIGIDSANPLVLGYNHRRINTTQGAIHMERGTYWSACMNLNDMMKHNVEWAHSIVGTQL